MIYIQWLDKADRNVSLIGGKAFNLRNLFAYGIKVPEGFCVTTRAFQHFVESDRISATIREVVSKIDFSSSESVKIGSKHLRRLIKANDLPADVIAEISFACQKLHEKGKNNFIAVRSSFPMEDSIDRSFAGQFDTFLCIPANKAIFYVKKCWESMFTERAISYGKDYYLKADSPSMAVIVQAMVIPDKAGISFTVHPVTGDQHTVVIEAIWGIGDLLVSGVITPDHFEINMKTKKIIEQIVDKRYRSVLRNGKLQQISVPEDKRNVSCLSKSELYDISVLSKNLEAYFGRPQDIEWAITGEKLYILQTRPVTKLTMLTKHSTGNE